MASATREQLQELLSDLEDDQLIERIATTGATVAEVTEALTIVEDERGWGEQSHVASSPRVSQVRAIIEESIAADEDDFAIVDQHDSPF